MADRLEVQFSSIRQSRDGTTVTARFYRLGDPVNGVSPRTLLQTVTDQIGPVKPRSRFVELYVQRAADLNLQQKWRLPDIVCSL